MYIKRFVKHYYIMLIPALLWLFFFSIVPMFGIVMAFQDYNPGQGILHSKFVGLANFEYMFQMSDITQVLRNTVVIAVGKIIGNIIIPLVFALLLNELAVKKNETSDPDNRIFTVFSVMGYSREDRAEYFRVYRTGESDHRIVRRRCGQLLWRSKAFPASGNRYGYLERIRL